MGHQLQSLGRTSVAISQPRTALVVFGHLGEFGVNGTGALKFYANILNVKIKFLACDEHLILLFLLNSYLHLFPGEISSLGSCSYWLYNCY